MKLRFTPRALRDLSVIYDYIRPESAEGAKNVRSAILSSLQLLTEHPHIGRAQSVEGVRKLVTRQYGYSVYYSIEPLFDEIAILSIWHPARQQPYSDR